LKIFFVNTTQSESKEKGKAVPLQDWSGPE